MDGIKRALLVAISVGALVIVAFSTYLLVAYPNIILLLTYLVVPVFLIVGLGLFRIARNRK
ncbi:hypothetical protein P0R31_33185 [Bradyrhizobium yuanmingense]|uniref:hypothetical protein n=1 Tax=Bradyrhizobium yuanmingense TaxID=108015 RepID=UPI0023B970F6|nr:hypothetical protein [Bradyrhizobium yuanmingense]MDF0522100.1 hypothetical protein [Bradyrhizobium yuanmingense]